MNRKKVRGWSKKMNHYDYESSFITFQSFKHEDLRLNQNCREKCNFLIFEESFLKHENFRLNQDS